MMNTERLLSFLGHTSTSDDFESFLLENDIKKMPKGDSTTRIKTKDKLISMEFDPTDSYKEKYLSPPIGDGWFTFESDRKSTRLNSSHSQISYAVFCLKKKKQ